jgi:hypothetical protein
MIGQGIHGAGHVERRGKKILGGEEEEKSPLRRPKPRWTLKMDHKCVSRRQLYLPGL